MFRYFDTFYGIHSQKNKTLINLLSFILRNYFDINENDSIDIVEKFNLCIWMKNELFPFIFFLTISVLDNGISFFFSLSRLHALHLLRCIVVKKQKFCILIHLKLCSSTIGVALSLFNTFTK